jgi:very-short-patch-repair endonuclease
MSEHKRGIHNVKTKEPRRKELRNSSTAAKAVLWTRLKKSQLDGKKFRRHGAPHFGPGAAEYDARRTEYMKERGIRVVRFENKRVYRDMESVLEEIRRNLTTEDKSE